MSLLRNIFGRREEVLSQEELEQYEEENIDSEIKNPHTIEDIVRSLTSIEEINRLRNFLDKRERELTGNYNLHKPESPVEEDLGIDEYEVEEVETVVEPPKELLEEPSIPDKSYEELKKEEIQYDSYQKQDDIEFGDEDISDEIVEPEFDEEPYLDNTNTNSIDTTQLEKHDDPDFVEIGEDHVALNSDSFSIESDLFFQKITDIFGKHNCSKQIVYGRFLTGIGKKDLFQIGIYKSESFMDNISIEEQNTWFITQIKQLEELKNFKVLNSKEGVKDLIWEKDKNHAIIISFKATQFLNENKFDFTL